MSVLEGLAKELHASSRETRAAAIEKIVDAAIRDEEFDDAHDLLRGRWIGPDADPDHALWEPLRDALRRILLARGRRRGLRQVIYGDTIFPADPSRLAWAAIVFVFDAASIYDGPAVLDEALALATPEQRAVHAIWWTQSEVRNGGFDQFFGNATAVVWPHLVAGLSAIGADGVASVVESAGNIFPGGNVPRDRKERLLLLERVERQPLAAIDEAFYSLLDTELWPKVHRFITRHRDAFFEQQ